jgi:vacuolar-type H+-ATPase subunit F/Vma7
MSLAVFLGDEVTATGYRLAGVTTRVPEIGAEASALAQACSEASLVLVSASVAARIPADDLRAAQLAVAPLVVVTPDLQGETPLPDIAARLRAQLGLAT